jgi:hypothetical protein
MHGEKRPSRHVLRFLEKLTALPYSALFSVLAIMVVGFGFTYWVLSFLNPEHSITGLQGMDPLPRFGNSIYFSTVTTTTVGYGDMVPLGFSKALAAIEAALGFFMLAVFVTKLVSFKTEIATQEVHTLMFENKFHHTREGLFTTRKDFDSIIYESQKHHAIADDSWDKMAIAYWEIQRLLEGIPLFYDDRYDLYTIDTKREKLLLEAVHRTLERLERMLATLDMEKVNWRHHERNDVELDELLACARSILPIWQGKSPHEHDEWFTKIHKTVELLEKKRKEQGVHTE